MLSFVTEGVLVDCYGIDAKKRPMHLFLSKNFSMILLRHITDSYVKEKWAMEVNSITKMYPGFEKESPIATATYIFSKKPNQEQCITIIGSEKSFGI